MNNNEQKKRNEIILEGNLTADCEMAYTKTGTPYVKFTIAHNFWKKVGETFEKSKTMFINCVAWSDLALNNEHKLTKGVKVTITGKLDQDSWVGNDGQKRKTFKIIVNDINYL